MLRPVRRARHIPGEVCPPKTRLVCGADRAKETELFFGRGRSLGEEGRRSALGTLVSGDDLWEHGAMTPSPEDRDEQERSRPDREDEMPPFHDASFSNRPRRQGEEGGPARPAH